MTSQLTLVAAIARNGVIGRDNKLPWHLPADLRFFKNVTLDKPVFMGRRTWLSIGRPLPRRQMIVLTHDRHYQLEGCIVVHSLEDALIAAGNAPEMMVIGGAVLFQQTLPLAQRMYLTQVEADVPGNTYFPEWNQAQWRLAWEEVHPADEKHAWPFRFQRWERILHSVKCLPKTPKLDLSSAMSALANPNDSDTPDALPHPVRSDSTPP